RENITVEVASDSRVDARLEVGPTAEAVLISESEPLLKTESGGSAYYNTYRWAAAAVGEREPRSHLPYRQGRRSDAPTANGIPEHIQPAFLSRAVVYEPVKRGAVHESFRGRNTRTDRSLVIRVWLRHHLEWRRWHTPHRPGHRPVSVLEAFAC